MQLPSFIFNAQNDTPEAVARRRALAEAMLARGTTGVASNVGEGLAQLGQAISGRIGVNRADGIAAKRKAAAYGMLGPVFQAPAQSQAASGTTAPQPAAGPSMGMSFNGPPKASSGGSPDLASGIVETANAIGISPIDLATAISYETAGTFDPSKAGPRTKWGQHRGLIQWGEPQAREYGVDWNNPVGSQLGANGAIASYLRKTGVKPGMGMMDIYSAINAGRVGRYGASDAAAGGAPGTVADKVRLQMAGHRAKAQKLLGLSGSAGSDMLGGSAGADTLSGREDMQDVPPGFILQSTVENGQFVQKVIPDPRKMAGVQPGLSAPSIGGPRPQPGLSSPPVPQSQAPSQAVPAAPPQVQPAVGPAPQAPQMAPQAPMSAYQRVMMQSLGKEAGGLAAPPNRAQAAAVMGNAQPMQSPFAPQSANLPSANLPSASGRYAADMRQIDNSGNSGAAPAGNRLGQLQSVISSPQFAWLEPPQQKFVMDEYERERAAANPDPMAKVQLETAQVNLEKARKDLASQGIETVVVGDALVNKQTGAVIYQGEPKTGEETATQKDYKFAIDQLRKRGVPENKLPSFQEWAKPKSRGIVFKGADGTEVTIGGSADETGIDGTSLPAEVGGRIGLGQAFLEKDYPEIIKMIEAGDATGPLDFASGYMGRGNSGIVQRRMATGIDALRRGLTGAGMGMSEAAEYAKRYAPQFTDDASTLKRKAEGLKTDLEAVAKGAIFGKAGKVGEMVPKSGAPSPQTPETPAPATPEAPAQQQSVAPPADAIQMLKADPSWEAVRDFNEIFGPGAAERILQESANGRK